ncbi:unnamed protein product [Linum trigynum]|uniref:Uncharacterized protein n=1 Tax=Linum trigynum TaxID=586398 RepID=A0AAV2EB54_9ROSI
MSFSSPPLRDRPSESAARISSVVGSSFFSTSDSGEATQSPNVDNSSSVLLFGDTQSAKWVEIDLEAATAVFSSSSPFDFARYSPFPSDLAKKATAKDRDFPRAILLSHETSISRRGGNLDPTAILFCSATVSDDSSVSFLNGGLSSSSFISFSVPASGEEQLFRRAKPKPSEILRGSCSALGRQVFPADSNFILRIFVSSSIKRSKLVEPMVRVSQPGSDTTERTPLLGILGTDLWHS